MRSKLIGLAAAVLGAVALALGGTWAGFTDTVRGPVALADAGELHLVLANGENGTSEPVVLADMAPGEKRTYRFTIANGGSVDGDLSWSLVGLADREDGCVPPELAAGDTSCAPGGAGELGAQLRVNFTLHADPGCTRPVLGSGLIRPTEDQGPFPLNGLRAGETRCFEATVEFVDRADNNLAQGDATTFRFDFGLDQAP